jgi:hypothetical protein
MDEDTLPCVIRFLPRREFSPNCSAGQGPRGRTVCGAGSSGTGIVSVMRRASADGGSGSARTLRITRHYAWDRSLRLFRARASGGFTRRGRPRLERVRRTRPRSAPKHNARILCAAAPRVRRPPLRPHNSRYVQVPPESGSGAASVSRCSFAGCVASWISLSLSIDTWV